MARRKPNILLITCDQWRGDSLSAAGHPVVRTPNADALAAEGVLFARHYAGAAPCSPARACLYTGLYQMNNRVCRNGSPLDRRHGNIALAARALGYDPTLFGYTDVSPDPRHLSPEDPLLKSYEGVLPGFTVRQLLPEHQKPWLSWLTAQGVDASPGFPDIHRPAGGVGKTVTNAPPVYSADETPAAFLTGEFIRWLGEQDKHRFAHLSFLSPHPPFIVPEPYNTLYNPADGPTSRGQKAGATGGGASLSRLCDPQAEAGKIPAGHEGQGAEFGEDEFRAIRALYWGMIRRSTRSSGASGRRSRRPAPGRHDRGAHLRPCRNDGRSFSARQGRLLRPEFPCTADRPRSRPQEGRRHARRPLHRGGRRDADAARPAWRNAARTSRRQVARALSRRRRARKLARGGALGVRLPLDRKRLGRAPLRPEAAAMQSGGDADRQVQIRAFRRRPAAAAPDLENDPGNSPTWRPTLPSCRCGSNWRNACSPGGPSISTSRWRSPH